MSWVAPAQGAESLPGIWAAHSLNTDAMHTHRALLRVLLGPSELTLPERHAMAVAVSVANGSSYCRDGHHFVLVHESGNPGVADAVISGRWHELPARMRALCVYADKLTRQPAAMEETDVEALRAQGLDDRAIVDANQFAAYFNYANRVATGLGVRRPSRTCPAGNPGDAARIGGP